MDKTRKLRARMHTAFEKMTGTTHEQWPDLYEQFADKLLLVAEEMDATDNLLMRFDEVIEHWNRLMSAEDMFRDLDVPGGPFDKYTPAFIVAAVSGAA